MFAVNRSGAALSSVYASGEQVVYDIKKLFVTVGEAVMTYEGPVVIEGQEALLIKVDVKALGSTDNELIYVNPKSYYPIIIKRVVHYLGKTEKIVERYDQENYRVVIENTSGGKTTTQTIEKSSSIDNIYGFIYRYRKQGRFKTGEKLFMNLPTKDLEIFLFGKQNLKLGKNNYNAFYMEGSSQGVKIWFEDSVKKIPLKIIGAVGFGKTSMVFRSISE